MPSEEYASAVASVAAADGPVPWLDLPYRSPVDADPLAHPAGTPPWCTAADVTLGKGGGGDAAATQRDFSWRLEARPGHRCSLQGRPVIRESSSAGEWSLTSATIDDFAVSPGGVLDPAHPGWVDFRWGLGRDGEEAMLPAGPRRLSITLPHRGGALVTIDTTVGWSSPAVHGTPAHLGSIRAQPLRTDGPPVYGGAYSATYAAAMRHTAVTAKLGDPISYDLWLNGPPTVPAGGPRCFGYRERVVNFHTGRVVAQETHELNCTGLVDLPVYGRVFAMRMALPAGLLPGDDLELDWQSDTGASTGASSATVHVRT